MDTLIKDLRFAVRGLRRTPGFTVAAVLALALGIGATTAIFSVVHAVLLRSLGFGDEERLLWVSAEQRGYNVKHGGISAPEVMDLRAFPLFEASGAVTRQTASLFTDRAERVEILQVSSGFFEALGVQPMFGRTFTPAEDIRGNDGVVLISARAWRRRFGGDPSVVGRSVTLDGRPHEIIGVLPEGFGYDGERDFYTSVGFSREQVLNARGYRYLEVVARLKPGVTLDATRKALKELSARLVQDHPNNYPKEFGWGLVADPIRDRFTSTTRDPLLVLLGAVLLVLLIACANVANLLLARSAQRGREFAVRAAIGASRARIVRQLLTEGLVMAAAGASLGVMLAMWSLSALLASAPRQIRDLADVRLSAPVLGFSIALSCVTTLIFALLPALRASKVDLVSSLKDGAHGTAHGGRLRGFLVAMQVAISIFLLAGAGLMLRSFERLLRVSPGFEVEGAMTAVLAPAGPTYDLGDGDVGGTLPGYTARRRYFADAVRAAAALPGAQAAGAIDRVPTVRGWSQTYFIEGHELRPGEPNPTDEMRFVIPGYFAAVRQPLIAGRDFTAADDANGGPVVIVNQAWVRRYFPGRDVIGKRFRLDELKQDRWRTIVGVVGDAKDAGLDNPVPPVFYLSALQDPPDRLTIVVRGNVSASALRQALAAVDPSEPVDQVRPLADVLAAALTVRRFPLQLLGVFAVLALLLSALGIYGVTSYAVAQRTREIGLRMAVGASPAGVVAMVLKGSLRVVGLGLLAGAAGALAGGRLIAAQLYGTTPYDPLTYAGICLVLGLVAVVASGVPAMRAARIDPMDALRTE